MFPMEIGGRSEVFPNLNCKLKNTINTSFIQQSTGVGTCSKLEGVRSVVVSMENN